MKEKLSLMQVCKLPDVQLHSKTAFFKSIVTRQSAEVAQMKDQIASLSYTVKVIGVQGEEVGITSKRIPMKCKKKEPQISRKSDYAPISNFLPHKSFYAHPLISIRREKEEVDPSRIDPILTITSSKNTIKVEDSERKLSAFKLRTRSMANIRASNKKVKHLHHNMDEIGKIEGKNNREGQLKKKSFSSLLKQCRAVSSEKINPIFHEQNALFKKIQKIKQVYPDAVNMEPQGKIERYESNSRQSFSSRSSLIRQYREQL